MSIAKVKLPDNTTEDIKDARLPDVTASDNGKMLTVMNGAWSAETTLKGELGYPITLDNITSDAANVGIRFRLNSAEVGRLYVSNANNLHFYDETGYRTVFHSGNTSIASSAVTIGSSTVGSSDAPIGYATQSRRLRNIAGTAEAGGYDVNTLLAGGGIIRNVNSSTYWANTPTDMGLFGIVAQVNSTSTELGAAQFALNGPINGETPTGKMWWRLRNNTGWANDWHRVWDSNNLKISTTEPTSSDGEDGDIWIVV